MIRSRRAIQVLLLTSSLASSALALPATYSVNSTTTSGSPSPNAIEFGMIGIAPSQTLRLSIIAYKPQPVPPYDPFCIAQLGFATSSGEPVGPTKTVNLRAGEGDSLDLNGSTLIWPPTPLLERIEVLPVVTLLPSPGGGAPSCLANAEIVDTFSGFSLVLAPGAIAWPPLPSFPLQGVAWGQVLRLNVVAWPPEPVRGVMCIAQLSFVDKLGHPAGPAPKMVNLGTGHADFLDVAGTSLVAHFGQRAELRPVITILPGAAAPSACVATAEVYDQFSGRTWAWGDGTRGVF